MYDQWNFTYFEINLNDFDTFTKNNSIITFRKANSSDVDNIINDIYPWLDGYGEYDKQYLENPDDHSVFICEKENKIIHYFLVFENSLKSPLIKTAINKKFLNMHSAYLGSTFTIPQERGVWITTYSVSFIISFLKQKNDIKKVLLLIHNKTPGALQFFKRLGFNIIPNAAPSNIIKWLLYKIIP